MMLLLKTEGIMVPRSLIDYCMKLASAVVLSLLFLLALSVSNSTLHLWPRPTSFSYDPTGPNITISPCQINFTTSSPDKIYIDQMVRVYQFQVWGCAKIENSKTSLLITVSNKDQFVATDLKHEKYTLVIKEGSWTLKADYFVGFLRGLETFSQLLEKQNNGTYLLSGLPISVTDSPQYLWRGLMIDTSRHFLSLSTIKRAIDGMLYSKLNVLHWHIVDEDSFPMQIPSLPELSESGSIAGVYSPADLRTVIQYAKVRGIRVVPEVDTPAHTESWGRSLKYRNITVTCNQDYKGQLDPTLNLTMEVVGKVMTFINSTFDDNYVHFGGDEIDYDCWQQRPSILEFMQSRKINTYKDLSIYYRKTQKAQFRQSISASKKVIYWANEEIDLPLDDEDVIQWWGIRANQDRLAGRPNPVILSNYDETYLDVGFNDPTGSNYRTYLTWRAMYAFEPNISKVNVIGGETCMWNEMGNDLTFDQKVFLRSNVLAERLWNTKINLANELPNIAARLQSQAERMRTRGFKIEPVTVQLCENNIQLCF